MDGLEKLGEGTRTEGVRATKPCRTGARRPDSFDFVQDRLDPAHTNQR